MLHVDDACISLSDRTFNYRLRVAPGEIVVILGASGSGKSTLLNLISGFLSPVSGDIRWCDESILSLAPDKRPATTLFQKHNLFEHLSVWKNVALGLHPGAKLNSAQQAQLTKALDDVGLAGFESRMPAELSGGEQQRVALARCLATHKPVLLLDEPYSALDTDLRVQMLALTRDIVATEKLCTLLVSHDPGDAVALQARVVKLAQGTLSEG